MSPRPKSRSIGWDLIGNLVLNEFIVAIILSLTMGTMVLSIVAEQRVKSMREIARVTAAGVMPLVADQQRARIRDQLDSILEAGRLNYIEGLRIVDPGGEVIAAVGAVPNEQLQSRSPLSIMTRSQTVREPIVVSGVTVAVVYVAFAPAGVAQSYGLPVAAAGLVLIVVVLISAPWSAWRLTRVYIDPIRDLEEYAQDLADGRLEAPIEASGKGEVGDLQATFNQMARTLTQREEDLRSAYDRLAEAYDELEGAKVDIERLSSVKTDFVAVAAHEIRSPLATIRLYVDLLESGQISEIDEHALGAVQTIGNAAKRLGAISADLMDAAMLERGALPIRFDRIWFDEIILDAATEARAVAGQKHITIQAPQELAELIIVGDALRLRQVLDNLLSNAVKFAPEGSTVSVAVTDAGDFIEVAVIDEGPGVPDEDAQRIFELFTRLDTSQSRSKDSGGFGLGLAISARIAEAHGGTLRVHRAEGHTGSIFTLRVPCSVGEGEEWFDSDVRVIGGDEG